MLEQNDNSHIVWVNRDNQVRGLVDKLQAHRQGLLHRAFSVLIYRKKDNHTELLLQKRSSQKYHSGGLWTNTCCSHDTLASSVKMLAEKRLMYEMGITAQLTYVNYFYYRADVGNGLVEHEIDQVFIGESCVEEPPFNPSEVEATRWIEWQTLRQDLVLNPSHYTVWLPNLLEIISKMYN